MVGDGVPGVVNADKEQQQRRSSNAKEGPARVRRSREWRQREYCVRRQRQHDMKQPVLELRSVYGLPSHAPSDDHRVRCAAEAHEAPKSCDDGDRLPWSAQHRRQEQDGAEMNDRRRRKRGAGLCRP